MKQGVTRFNILKYIYIIGILTLCFCIFVSAASEEYLLISGLDYYNQVYTSSSQQAVKVEYECFDSDDNLLTTRAVWPYTVSYYDDVSGSVGLLLYPSRFPSNTTSINCSAPLPTITNVADYVGSLVFKDFSIVSPILPTSGSYSVYITYLSDSDVITDIYVSDLTEASYSVVKQVSGWNLYGVDPLDLVVDLPLDVKQLYGIRVEIGELTFAAWDVFDSSDCYFQFNQVNYTARSGYNAGLEMLIQNQIKTAEEITGAIEDLKGDLLDVPDFEFEAPPGATAEEDVVNTLMGQITDFFEQLSVDVGTVIDSPTGLSYIDPQHLAFVSAYIIDPIFNAGVFKPIITITFPIVFLLIIFGFAGLVGSFRSGGKHD